MPTQKCISICSRKILEILSYISEKLNFRCVVDQVSSIAKLSHSEIQNKNSTENTSIIVWITKKIQNFFFKF